MVPAGNHHGYQTIVIGTGPSQVSSSTIGWMQTESAPRAPTTKELLEQKKAKSLENDRWKSRNKTNMPQTRLLSSREKARLEKKGKKK